MPEMQGDRRSSDKVILPSELRHPLRGQNVSQLAKVVKRPIVQGRLNQQVIANLQLRRLRRVPELRTVFFDKLLTPLAHDEYYQNNLAPCRIGTPFAKCAMLSRVKMVLYFQATGKVSARQKLEGVYTHLANRTSGIAHRMSPSRKTQGPGVSDRSRPCSCSRRGRSSRCQESPRRGRPRRTSCRRSARAPRGRAPSGRPPRNSPSSPR